MEPQELDEPERAETDIEVESASSLEPEFPPELELPPELEPEPEPDLQPEPKKAPIKEEPVTRSMERKLGLIDRILPRKEVLQPRSVKPLKVEKEVLARSEASVLLIEEHQYRADRILKALEKTRLQSIEVRHASSGKLGLRELRQPYDAVILDMNLTDIDPDLIVREISRWKVTTPLIILNDVDTTATIVGRVDLTEVKELEYSEAAVRQLPDLLEKMLR
jgi:CheY-like chemotaxis protein